MAFGFRSGSQSVRTNPRWVRWFKIAAKLDNGANTPRQTSSLRQLMEKTLKSLNNE